MGGSRDPYLAAELQQNSEQQHDPHSQQNGEQQQRDSQSRQHREKVDVPPLQTQPAQPPREQASPPLHPSQHQDAQEMSQRSEMQQQMHVQHLKWPCSYSPDKSVADEERQRQKNTGSPSKLHPEARSTAAAACEG